MKAKKLSALLLAVVMIFSLAACGSKTPKTDSNATRIFTDSTGREVEVPAQIDKGGPQRPSGPDRAVCPVPG